MSEKSVNEGDNVEICVIRSAGSSNAVDVMIIVDSANGTASIYPLSLNCFYYSCMHSLARSNDFTSNSSFTITVAAGQNNKGCLTIPTRSDTISEQDETIVLNILDNNAYTIGSTNKLTITINDGKNNYNTICSVLLSASSAL